MSAPDDMITYAVRAVRWTGGWELHVEGIGVTQSKTLNDAEAMARDYIALDTGADPEAFLVCVTPEVGGTLDAEARAARTAVTAAEQAQRAAAELSRGVARRLKTAGLSGREIAVVLRVTPQRVSQLLRSAGAPGGHAHYLRAAVKLHGGADAKRDLPLLVGRLRRRAGRPRRPPGREGEPEDDDREELERLLGTPGRHAGPGSAEPPPPSLAAGLDAARRRLAG